MIVARRKCPWISMRPRWFIFDNLALNTRFQLLPPFGLDRKHCSWVDWTSFGPDRPWIVANMVQRERRPGVHDSGILRQD